MKTTIAIKAIKAIKIIGAFIAGIISGGGISYDEIFLIPLSLALLAILLILANQLEQTFTEEEQTNE